MRHVLGSSISVSNRTRVLVLPPLPRRLLFLLSNCYIQTSIDPHLHSAIVREAAMELMTEEKSWISACPPPSTDRGKIRPVWSSFAPNRRSRNTGRSFRSSRNLLELSQTDLSVAALSSVWRVSRSSRASVCRLESARSVRPNYFEYCPPCRLRARISCPLLDRV